MKFHSIALSAALGVTAIASTTTASAAGSTAQNVHSSLAETDLIPQPNKAESAPSGTTAHASDGLDVSTPSNLPVIYSQDDTARQLQVNLSINSLVPVTVIAGPQDTRTGQRVSYSRDGTIVAVSATLAHRYGTSYAGQVRVYQKDPNTNAWNQLGQSINPKDEDFHGNFSWYGKIVFGNRISLSGDGKTVAIASNSDANYGFVRVYKLDSSTVDWIQVGGDIMQEEIPGREGVTQNFPDALSLSGDGTKVAVGASRADNNPDWCCTGRVTVLQLDSNENWAKLGDHIEGDEETIGTTHGVGQFVNLSNDGYTVACSYYMKAVVFEWNADSETWVEVVSVPSTEVGGQKVAISADGNVLVIGESTHDKVAGTDSNHGRVRVYRIDSTTGGLAQLGGTFLGDHAWASAGASLAISDDGATFAYATNQGPNNTPPPTVFVFEWDSNTETWVQFGSKLEGPVASEFGTHNNMALSGDGNFIAAGAPATMNPRYSGRVHIFELVRPPTSAPTQAPTSPGPWTIDYVGAETDFTSEASNELEVGFFVGAGREVDVKVLKTCDAEAEVPPSMYNKTVSRMPDAPNASNLTHSNIIVGYTFDKAEMVNSTLWNTTTTKFNFCQVTRLTNPTPDGTGEAWVIAEDRRQIAIKFDLEANFVVDVNLTAGTIKNATKTIDFDEDVDAYKCKGGSTDPFGVDDSALPPNTKLAVCVTIENDAVNIADVTDMDINQEDVNTGVIDNGNVLVPAITDKRNIPQQGSIVETRVPLDKFTFENGKNITVSGTVKLVLSGTAGTRKLRALVDEDDLAVVDTEEAGFAISVNLQREAEGFAPIGSSGGYAIVGKGLAAFGLAIVAVIGLVM